MHPVPSGRRLPNRLRWRVPRGDEGTQGVDASTPYKHQVTPGKAPSLQPPAESRCPLSPTLAGCQPAWLFRRQEGVASVWRPRRAVGAPVPLAGFAHGAECHRGSSRVSVFMADGHGWGPTLRPSVHGGGSAARLWAVGRNTARTLGDRLGPTSPVLGAFGRVLRAGGRAPVRFHAELFEALYLNVWYLFIVDTAHLF